jgi:NAD(P)-dependent dehydrogenase (short-subunit alcohol dehydrogenase family)
VGRPEDIAATVAFLVSPPAAAFVGQILQPNGGTTRGLA